MSGENILLLRESMTMAALIKKSIYLGWLRIQRFSPFSSW